MEGGIEGKIAGGGPAASHFFLRRQEKVTKKKATPVCRPLRGFPALLDRSGFLINSHDPLRGHVLKHIRQNSLTSLRYSAAHRGIKAEVWCALRARFLFCSQRSQATLAVASETNVDVVSLRTTAFGKSICKE